MHHQIIGVDRVRIGVQAAKVFQRHGIDHRALGRAEQAFDDVFGVGPADRIHRVKTHREATREQRPDGVEIEAGLHQRGVVGHRVDDLDHHLLDALRDGAASTTTTTTTP